MVENGQHLHVQKDSGDMGEDYWLGERSPIVEAAGLGIVQIDTPGLRGDAEFKEHLFDFSEDLERNIVGVGLQLQRHQDENRLVAVQRGASAIRVFVANNWEAILATAGGVAAVGVAARYGLHFLLERHANDTNQHILPEIELPSQK